MIKLIGVLIILIGFKLKLDSIAVVVIAGLSTGLVAGMSITEILTILGTEFVKARYMTLLLLTLGVIGVLERNGLRERATYCVSKLKGATAGKIVWAYVVVRMIAAAFSIRLSGHVQFVRPLIFPMAKGAYEKDGNKLSAESEEDLKGYTNAAENYANFYGQNLFVASAGVLLVVGTLESLGVTVLAYDVVKACVPVAIAALIVTFIQCKLFDIKLNREKNKEGKN